MSEFLGDKAPSAAAQDLIDAINEKFVVVDFFSPADLRDDTFTRDHEERLSLVPTVVLPDCLTAERMTIARPIPGEEAQARAAWDVVGSYNVHAKEIYKADQTIQTIFHVLDGQLYKKVILDLGSGVVLPSDYDPESPEQQNLRDRFRRHTELNRAAHERAARLRGQRRIEAMMRLNRGDAVDPETAANLAEWVSTATVEDPGIKKKAAEERLAQWLRRSGA